MNSFHRDYDFSIDTINDIEFMKINFGMNENDLVTQCIVLVRALTDVSVLPYLDELTKELIYKSLLEKK